MITSSSNQKLKNLSLLMKKSKERKNQGVFVIEGPKMFYEAPKTWVKCAYVSENYLEEEARAEEFYSYCGNEISYEVVAEGPFKAVSDTQTPQGIIAVIRTPEYAFEDLLKKEQTSLLILESIQDPGNLGTMVRTGEGAGCTGIIMNSSTVDLFNPKTIRSTMGSIYRMPFYVTENLEETLQTLKKRGVKLYAAHLKGELSYDEPDYTGACGFLIGNEGNGLSDNIADCADTYIRIPMEGKVESLNAAISATLLMYECNRQRRRK